MSIVRGEKMASRMERYQESENGSIEKKRTEKHKDMYQNFYTKTVYKEIGSIDEVTTEDRAVDLSVMKLQKTTRENYHKVKEIEDFMTPVIDKKTDDLSIFFNTETKKEPKIYDINSVLEQAKKNREQKDELEKRRKLRNTDYNILANLKPEELEEKFKEQTQNASHTGDKLEELIHTITSSSLRKEIDLVNNADENDEDLLSELMPKDLAETVISEDLSKEILDKEIELAEKEKNEEKDGIDHSFYTRSMDLSDTDFDEGATDEEFIEKTHPLATFFKVLIAVLLVIGIAVLVFYFMNQL